jgi:hypothetical protein
MRRLTLLAAALAAILAGAAPAALAQHSEGSATAGMQGDRNVWKNSPYMHQFYDLAVATCAKGCTSADLPDFQAKSMAIFAAFGTSMHMPPAGMQDHLKGIPAQVIQIATADPNLLSSYDNFWLAMVGPD